VGCSKNNSEKDCIDAKLEEFDMVKYEEQEIDCQFFLELYHYKNKQYFLLINHCVDMAWSPIDCDGNGICNDLSSFECIKFNNEAERIGIIGIDS